MPPFNVREMLIELHLMRLELERSLEFEQTLLTRNGSIRGRKLHVYNTLRRIQTKTEWKRDYRKEEENRIVVYTTTCGVYRKVWERCKDSVYLLKALNIKTEVRDLNLAPSYVDELLDRMQLDTADRELVFHSLPMVYVNGNYFGNDETLIYENESKNLVELLRDFKGRLDCFTCGASGYIVCSKCRGGKKTDETFNIRLRCATCNVNGIAPCPDCTPRR